MRSQPSRQIIARYLGRHLRRLVRAMGGVQAAKDPEAVHQTRVACRRLRAGLRLFEMEIGRKRTRRWRRGIRKLAQTLGSARDLDVQIQSTLVLMAQTGDPELTAGEAYWLAHLEAERAAMQKGLIRAVKRFKQSGVVGEMRGWIRRMAASRENALPDPNNEVIAPLPEPVRNRLDQCFREMLVAAESLADPADIEGHHALRIAVKKLRYSLEPVASHLGRVYEAAVETLRSLQSLLGEIHDFDVWSMQLENALDPTQRKACDKPRWLRPERFQPGLQYLRRQYCRLRQERFDTLVHLWSDPKIGCLWDSLSEQKFMPAGNGAECHVDRHGEQHGTQQSTDSTGLTPSNGS